MCGREGEGRREAGGGGSQIFRVCSSERGVRGTKRTESESHLNTRTLRSHGPGSMAASRTCIDTLTEQLAALEGKHGAAPQTTRRNQRGATDDRSDQDHWSESQTVSRSAENRVQMIQALMSRRNSPKPRKKKRANRDQMRSFKLRS